LEGGCERREVSSSPRVAYIQVLRCSGGTVEDKRHPADDDEVDVVLDEGVNQWSEVGKHWAASLRSQTARPASWPPDVRLESCASVRRAVSRRFPMPAHRWFRRESCVPRCQPIEMHGNPQTKAAARRIAAATRSGGCSRFKERTGAVGTCCPSPQKGVGSQSTCLSGCRSDPGVEGAAWWCTRFSSTSSTMPK
jgi:hypothetical protein